MIPGGPKMAAAAPTKSPYVAGQNPESEKNRTFQDAPAASVASSGTGWTAVPPGSGGRIPVSHTPVEQSYDMNPGTSMATRPTSDPYITRYAPQADTPEESAADSPVVKKNTENVPLRWVPVSAPPTARETPSPVPGNVAEVSYARRFPYSVIVPPPLQPGMVVPREETERFFPEVQAPPPVETYSETREAVESDAWVRTLHGPYVMEMKAAPKTDTYQEERQRKLAMYFDAPAGETPLMAPSLPLPAAREVCHETPVKRQPERGSTSAWQVVVSAPPRSLENPMAPTLAETRPAVGNQVKMPENLENPEIYTAKEPEISAKKDIYHAARPVQPHFLKEDPAVIDLHSMPEAPCGNEK